jgi:hypothetical protein
MLATACNSSMTTAGHRRVDTDIVTPSRRLHASASASSRRKMPDARLHAPIQGAPERILQDLQTQRWDDHRYYHQSRINQTLHFVSALSFLAPTRCCSSTRHCAALHRLGRVDDDAPGRPLLLRAPGYDHVNQATNEHKEAIKVGYNLRRKVVLLRCGRWCRCCCGWRLRPAA